MKVIYIYSHPDDESFGPAPAISKQRRQGHEVYLLTLTRGGATKQRFKYDYSIEQMGQVRYQEMQRVAQVLDLNGMTVLDLPDSGLKELDPREIERVIIKEMYLTQPQVVVTYPAHGISGFHDHLVTHAIVKYAFVALRGSGSYLRRLAFHTITEEQAQQSRHFRLNGSAPEEIDCVIKTDEVDIEKSRQALDCYATFQETIEKTGIRDQLRNPVAFEIFQERHDPPLSDLFEGLK